MNEIKLARICWNDKNWEKPSGSDGKSPDERSYENEYGFGFEEWNFDFTKLINGFKYAYLTPISKSNFLHQGKIFDIWLYSFNSSTKERICIGRISNATILDESESHKVAEIYKSNGWLEELKEDLWAIDIDPSDIENYHVNMKFKPDDFIKFDMPIDLKSAPIGSRYQLYNFESKHNSFFLDQICSGLDSDINIDTSLTLTEADREALIKIRIGQSLFRKDVISKWDGERCALTGINIRQMLIASHIKPWKDCDSPDEKLDGANGILLCAHVDKLFDRYLITFRQAEDNTLKLEISKNIDRDQLKAIGIQENMSINLNQFSSSEKDRRKLMSYLNHHNLKFAENEV